MTLSPESRTERTTTPAPPVRDVWSWLAEIHVRQMPIALRAPSAGCSGVSNLLAVDPDRQLVLLDALHKAGASVAAGDKLHLETDLDEQRVSIECRVQDVVPLPEGPAYLAVEPKLERLESRRATNRVHLQPSMLLDAAISQRDFGKLPAHVLDLSQGGFGAQTPNVLAVPNGSRVHCSLVLPDVKVFVDATVRHTRVGDEGIRLGLQFKDVTPILEGELKRAMEMLQQQLESSGTNSEPPKAA